MSLTTLPLLLLLPTITSSHSSLKFQSLNGSWDKFNQNIKFGQHTTLPHHVVVLHPGTAARLYCNSESMVPKLELAYTNDTSTDVPKEQLLVGQQHQLSNNPVCEMRTGMENGPKDYNRFTSCTLTANYSVQDVWWNCGFDTPSRTNIRVVTTPARTPFHYPVPPLTKHLEWWCLRNRHVTWTAAGHLLWMFGTRVKSRDQKNETRDESLLVADEELVELMVVERFYSWELEPGDLFECNGTVWRWAEDYPCLKMLPNGWPALDHCHGKNLILMVIVIIVFFIFVYCNLLAGQHVYFVFMEAVNGYIQRKRGPRVYIPMIPKDGSMPYSNMQDIKLVQGNFKVPITQNTPEYQNSTSTS